MSAQPEARMDGIAAKMDLDADNLRVAHRVSQILDAKDAKGELVFSNLEVRDFMMACTFELGLPLSWETQLVMNRFLEDLDIKSKQPTADDLVAAVQRYFDANPLNPTLSKVFQSLGSAEKQRGREGFKSDGARLNASLAATGLNMSRRAPHADHGIKPGAGPRPKRGLS
jgi:hypothetical protein